MEGKGTGVWCASKYRQTVFISIVLTEIYLQGIHDWFNLHLTAPYHTVSLRVYFGWTKSVQNGPNRFELDQDHIGPFVLVRSWSWFSSDFVQMVLVLVL